MVTTEKQFDMPGVSSTRVIAWEAPEFIEYQKGAGWLMVVWLIALGISGFAIWQYSVTFLGLITSLAALAGALAVTTQGRLKPKLVRISIDTEGVTVNRQHHLWKELKSFWLVFTPLNQAFYLETTRRLLPVIPLQIGKMDPEIIRTMLLTYLPERTDKNEEFSDRLARMMKF